MAVLCGGLRCNSSSFSCDWKNSSYSTTRHLDSSRNSGPRSFAMSASTQFFCTFPAVKSNSPTPDGIP